MITLVSSSPNANNNNVSSTTEIFLAFEDTSLPIIYADIKINGVRACLFDISLQNNYPSFYTNTTGVNNFRSFNIKPRRHFNFGERITINYTVRTASSELVDVLEFIITDQVNNLNNQKLNDSVAESLKQFVVSLADTKIFEYKAQLYRTILDTELNFFTPDFRLPLDIINLATNLNRNAVPVLRKGLSGLDAVVPLWILMRGILLRENKIPPSYIDTLDEFFNSDYPENKIGVIAASVLFYAS